ncbi:hypothetical protein HOY82DRAFT_639657 [Tuber indicum]|nr:hypothetical protein HOY82DRAFT_639657 [Tuber indicum]
MATASKLNKIRCNLIKERLGAFCHLFESTSSLLTYIVVKNLALDLIQALQIEPAARTLPSRIADRSVSSDLAILFKRLIVRNEPGTPTLNDTDIWRTVFELIVRMSSSTPPTAFEKAVFDTPLRSSSVSQRGIEQIHDEELTVRRYLKGKGPFIEWFMKFQDIVLSGLGRRYYTSVNKVLRGSEAYRKLDIFLTPTDTALPEGELDWSNVLNPDENRSAKTLVRLVGYAREVFGSHPERQFVSLMRLWVFDRSGPYNSEKFNIHKESERFVKVLAGYALMSDAELGLNTFIKHDGNGKYIVTRDPIALTKAIVCWGTTCYRGKRPGSTDWEYIVKFAWPSDKRQREGELLKLAKEKGVTGIAVWRPLKKAFWVNSNPESSRLYSKTSLRRRSGSSVAHLIGLGIGAGSATTSPYGQKRKRDERFDGVSRLKRPKSDSSHASATNLRKEEQLDAIGTPSIQETVVDSLADYQNECIQEAEADSLTDCESETYGNQVNYCLVTSPAGRPLRKYQSARELWEVLCDAIRGRLIDLDLAKELDGMPSSARHRTGTMQFMGIEVLEGKGHAYWHELDTGRQKPKKVMRPKTNILQGWYTGAYTEIANIKLCHNVIAEFTPEFENLKPLACELQSAFFPIRDGDIFIGTFHDHSIKYDRMIEAFDRAITSLRKEE